MGGNAFNTGLRRIARKEIYPTIQYVVKVLDYPGLTVEYVYNNLMGSAGKQADSGDLDIAIDQEHFNLHALASRTRACLGDAFISTKTLKGGQFQSSWPIEGNPEKGRIQIDFIKGKPEWLKFTHWSPGKDVSPYKGVFISTLFGVLAKVRKEYELYHPETGDRLARVGLRYDLEKGFHRKWEVAKRTGRGMDTVDPYTWESKVGYWYDKLGFSAKLPPHFPVMGYVDDPEEGLRMIYGKPVAREEVNTLEKAWAKVEECFDPETVQEIKERTVEALLRSAARYDYTREELENLPVWS